ncbi:PfkB family carbohydrate kinase [Sphingobacterium sp. E70]|nr:PfkB family carbohydrate kinase [Sphingobacterium sp. E70]ULT22322.1 PfkB family carbohydrate kinase [Sphingobacterium sp. E70]
MSRTNIVVLGSSNTDMVIKASHLPVPGETVLGGQFFMAPGGKGANQAVAAARAGAQVSFIAKVGNDIFGQQAITHYRQEGIQVDTIFQDPTNPSGIALISVDAQGENCILVAPDQMRRCYHKKCRRFRTSSAKLQYYSYSWKSP